MGGTPLQDFTVSNAQTKLSTLGDEYLPFQDGPAQSITRRRRACSTPRHAGRLSRSGCPVRDPTHGTRPRCPPARWPSPHRGGNPRSSRERRTCPDSRSRRSDRAGDRRCDAALQHVPARPSDPVLERRDLEVLLHIDREVVSYRHHMRTRHNRAAKARPPEPAGRRSRGARLSTRPHTAVAPAQHPATRQPHGPTLAIYASPCPAAGAAHRG